MPPGVTNGTVKGNIVIHQGEPYVIELAARLSGGFFCTREIPLNTGVDFIGCAPSRWHSAKQMQPTSCSPGIFAPVIQRYAFPAPAVWFDRRRGRGRQIAGVEENRRRPQSRAT